MRLNKFIAGAGVASRRKADQLIRAATVTVNGEVVTDPALEVSPQDDICYDGQRVEYRSGTVLIMLHKPVGVITTAQDERGRRTVLDLVTWPERLFPVGRLDKNTSGLVLLTNDGELANRLAHPRYRIPRIYEAVIDRPLQAGEIAKLQRGVFIGLGEFGRADLLSQTTVKTRSTLRLELRQGKKREIRRIFEFLNRRLFRLKRICFGPLELGDLPPGKWRLLEPGEIDLLKGVLRGYKR